MSENNKAKSQARQAQLKEDRLKAALKANMARRKAQAKARASDKPAADDDAAQDHKG